MDMRRSSFHAITFGILLCSSFAAHAQQTTLYYQGAPMVGTLSYGGNPGNGSTPPQLTQIFGTIVLVAPLADTQANQVPLIVSFTFNGGVPTSSYQGGPPPPPFAGPLTVTTVKGVITAWKFQTDWEGGNSTVDMMLTDAGDTYNADTFNGSCRDVNGVPTFCYWSAVNTTPGTWLVPQASYAVSQSTLAWWTARAWQLSAQYNGEVADVAYLNMIDNQVQSQRDANWNRLVYLNTLANQLQAQIATCRANKGVC
jgi:hypothetical protein